MKRQILATASVVTLLMGCTQAPAPEPAPAPKEEKTSLVYPVTKTVDQVDDYHGVSVADPYRWLEDDVRESEDVANWVKAQNAVTRAYLEPLDTRQAIVDKLTEIWNYEKYTTPELVDGKLFYRKNDGLQNQYVLYMQDEKGGEPVELINPNNWSEDGTKALSDVVVSPNANYLAYSIQEAGSDWRTWKVMDLNTLETLEDEVKWVKFSSVSWNQDESGFFYTRFPEPKEGEKFQSLNMNAAVYHHKLGNAQSQDNEIYSNAEHPDWGFFANTSDNGRWLVITVWKGTDSRYQVLVKDLQDENSQPEYLVEGFDYEYTFLGSRGDTAYFQTTNNASLGRVVAKDLNNLSGEWQEVVPEIEATLGDVALTKTQIVAHYIEDAKSALYTFDEAGQKTAIALPTIGQVGSYTTSQSTDTFYYSFSSFNYPNTSFKHDLSTGTAEVVNAPNVAFNPEDFVVKQVFYTSKDGTRVPMTISHLKDVKPNGDLPTLLYGYGGFNVSLLPRFSLTRLAWMMMGGVYAQPNIRGGGEYGKEWHQAAVKLNRQNAFDDFIAAGEYLIEEGYTNKDKLAVWGGSNGGLLVGAVVNQRPDLFEAALPAVGVMDMLRFQLFTAGRYWVDDFGSSDNPEEFKALYAYSPYHNIQKGAEYPAVLVLTADTDDRVVPGHSFKYIAALQAAQGGDEPVLVRIESAAGHGAGTPTAKTIEQYADMWAFLAEELDMESRL
ncbi:S9 family peptidase [Alteromonas sediminis]|uniref:prolyl oligopeptidase n=1 Tax=Alteromonas sediminis TaxID=2259342 RepID=A0A3N5XZI4_9ALTE|nr:prolyl oligopeptidase family serine peptidase [Alteromonas sediminis]RPJ66492.1 S9 family peptidase [Alteromonas sediminis]